jgi:hypothetical protein
MDVQGDHQIVTFGPDKMVLFDNATGTPIIDCTRDPATGDWTVTAPKIGSITIPADKLGDTHRQTVIQAMITHALAALPGTGYSCIVPHGLESMP